MKIILTGHTSPMGSVLFDYYKSKAEVVGISRSTGYDLTEQSTLNQVAELVLDSDVFINLANVGVSQIQLLNIIDKKYTKENKIKSIITVGTLATQLDPKLLAQAKAHEQYIKNKQQLDAVHKVLANRNPFGDQIKYTLLRVLNFGPKTGDRQGEPTCDAEDMIRTFEYILNEPMYIGLIDLRRY